MKTIAFSSPNVRVNQYRPGIVLVTLDMAGRSANILSREMIDEIDQAMARLMEQDGIEGVILASAKRSIFIAGADLQAIQQTLDWPEKKIIQFCQRGRAMMARFSRSPFVTVAAIDGACVGGGLELPLWCDGRVATDHRSTRLGLPEVKLGLVPGWGGTARTPRMIGFERAAELITRGELISSAQALEIGLVDRVVSREDLLPQAFDLIRTLQRGGTFIEQRRAIMGPVPDLSQIDAATERIASQIVANREIFPFAPTVVLEHMVRTAPLPQQEAWKSESVAMAQVWGSPANRGLLHHFFLVDHNKKHPGLVDLRLQPMPVQTVGIVGVGQMGKAIAQSCLDRGLSVLLLDADRDGAIEAARQLTTDSTSASATPIEDYGRFSQCDLVIESVVETAPVKREVLQKIDAAVSEKTLIASNTSAIPIEKLAEGLTHPDRFCGIHFCHPELMALVEVVCGPESSEQTIADAVGFVRHLKKMAVALNDGPGFVVNRLLAAMIDQSIRLLTQGESVEAIDGAMRDFGFLGGPFEIIDVIGADTALYAGRTMWEAGLSCVTLSPILPRMVKRGRLGRKTGQGFYRYPDRGGEPEPDPTLLDVIGDYLAPNPSPALAPNAIVQQILSAIVLEASRILDEEIVDDLRDIDLCLIHGFSFPRHQGGALFWADQFGIESILQTLRQIARQEPRMAPSPMLEEMARKKSTFYS